MVAETLVIVGLAGIIYLILRKVTLKIPAKTPEPSATNELAYTFEEGERFLKENRYDLAEQKFLQIAAKNPRFPRLQNRLGIIYLERGDYKRAIEAFEGAVREDPSKAVRHANLSTAYRAAKKMTLARKELERATELAPDNGKYKRLLEELQEK